MYMYMNPTKFLTYEELIKSFWRLQYSFYSRILFLRLLCCCIFSDEMQTGIDDENLSDAEQNKIRSDDESKTPIMSSKAVRELYSITPGIDSADSSDNESGETENTRLLKDEAPCSSAKPTAKEKPSNSSSHCDEGRPLLSRQGEVDQCSDSSMEMNIETTQRIKQDSKPSNSVSSVSEVVMASVGTVTKDDEEEDTESQRVVPIVLTLSPTKNGNNQISSIVATRDLSSAMTRPSGMPAAPRSPKQKNAKGSRSPKSPRSLRALFSCSGSPQTDGDAVVGKNENEKDTSPFDPRALEESAGKSCFSENTCQPKCDDKDGGGMDVGGSNSKGELIFANNDTINICGLELSRTADPRPSCTDANSSNDPTIINSERTEPSAPIPPPLHVESSAQRYISQEKSVGCSTENSFEETANNSDKGYESVDNSPPCVENDDGLYRPLNANGSVSAARGLSETANPIWVPLLQSKASPRQHRQTAFSDSGHKLFNQTMV